MDKNTLDKNTLDKDNLKTYINKLLELEKEEEKIKAISSNLRKEKENVSSYIMDFMSKNQITDKDIIFGNKKIKYTASSPQEGITKGLLLAKLTEFLKTKFSDGAESKAEETAQEAIKYIYSSRDRVEKNYLQISNM
jgi:hypothetical protein